MEHRDFSFKIKGGVSDSGSFTGMGATYGNTDLGGDSIQPGAFTKTLQATKTFPLLWQHDPHQPIGTVTCVDSPQGLQVQGQLLLSDATGAKAYNLLKAQVLRGLSIGYDTIVDTYENGIRLLKEVRLWEVSVVTFPMNLAAGITSIKTMSADERGRHLAEISRHTKAIEVAQQGIREHLGALCEVGAADDLSEDPDELEAMGMLLAELKTMAEFASA